MKDSTIATSSGFADTSVLAQAVSGEGLLTKLARRAVWSRLQSVRRGELIVVEGNDRQVFGRVTEDCPLRVTITVHAPHTYVGVAFGGTVGAGEAYRHGYWTCDDLTGLVRLFVVNRELLDGMEGGLATLTRPLLKILHSLHRNTIAGSRRNIAAHYDLGNEFFRLMLDDTMMYSCAYFERTDASLEEASRAKNERICRKLQLRSSDHLLEIGSGWGGFALHAASRYGCRVTTTTISQQQYEIAVRRVEEAGLRDRVTVLLKDYRDLPDLGILFDKLVSIEMIEAVGHRYYEPFFGLCGSLLKPNGLMLLQAITIDERLYPRAKRSVDFIQHFIFPGSCIPCLTALCRASTRASDLRLVDLEDIGRHYPLTLQRWRKNLADRKAAVQALGYTAEFHRIWDLYLSYCEGGFLERSISAVQLLFAKPDWRPPHA